MPRLPKHPSLSCVDFLGMGPTLRAPRGTIITNPPYKLAVPFVNMALRYANTVVMLCKLNFLSGQERSRHFWKTTPLKTVYILARRASFDKGTKVGGGAGVLEFAWYVWENGYAGPPTIAWLL